MGRFTQADTIVPVASQGTQAWDRYAYTNNNPLRYTDPTGHCLTGAVADAVFCIFVAALIIGAVADASYNAYTQYQDKGFVEAEEVITHAWEGAVYAGAPFVAVVAAPEVLSTTGYSMWSAGESIGSKTLSNAGTSTFSSSLALNEFLSQPVTISTGVQTSISRPDLYRNGTNITKSGPAPNLGLHTQNNPYQSGNIDIFVDNDGFVEPSGGGLSAWSNPDPKWEDTWIYPSSAKPPSGINIREDYTGHWLFEPGQKMTFTYFKNLLKQTISDWIR